MRSAGNKFQHRQAVIRKSESFERVTMDHIRAHGFRDLLVYCDSGRCHHGALKNADWPSDDTPVCSLCPRMVYTRCAMTGADVRQPLPECHSRRLPAWDVPARRFARKGDLNADGVAKMRHFRKAVVRSRKGRAVIVATSSLRRLASRGMPTMLLGSIGYPAIWHFSRC
jgi:hypothetical protein